MEYETEEQQVEAFKQWWKENGKAVIAGVVLGAVAILGWKAYGDYQTKQAYAASALFNQTIEATESGDVEKASQLAMKLGEEHGGSLYASYSYLGAARAAVDAGDLDAAATNLLWVVENGSSKEIKLIASVRLARVLGVQGNTDEGLKLLPTKYDDGFIAIVEEARGDLEAAAGNNEAARAAYQAAADTGNVADAEALTIKLNEMAPADAS